MSSDPQVPFKRGDKPGQVDQICDDFRAAWLAENRPRIEDYLDAAEQSIRCLLREKLLLAELNLIKSQGGKPNRGEYVGRFPDCTDLIDQFFGRTRIDSGGTPAGVAATKTSEQARPSPDNLIGKKLSNYTVLDRLGVGGMGEVYLAEDGRLGRQVALKLLAAEFTTDESRVRRFEKEARAASALNHPNIVTIHDIGQAEAGHFIVMEFVQGRTLQAVSREPLSLRSLAELGEQIAKALAVAHAAGIAHRDVKPANLMVRDDGYVKVLDFGLVRLLAGSVAGRENQTRALMGREDSTAPAPRETPTATGMLLGTVPYMSPEQARGEPVSTATDVFSLGTVLYEMATGTHPFEADSQIGLLHAILTRRPIPPSHLDPETSGTWETLLLQMLQKDPRLRPTATEVEDVLAQLARATVEGKASRMSLPARTPTVGRDQERAAMRVGYESAAAGRGRMLCVTGEPGIGKTTVVEELLDELLTSGEECHIARGRCSERLAGAEAYLPLLEALDSLLHGAADDSVARTMKQLAPTWYVHLAPLTSEDSSDERVLADVKMASQARMKRELAAFLQELCNRRPLVFFFDDLHWADVATVDLLGYLATKFRQMRILVLATYRPSDLLLAKHPFLQLKLDLQGRGDCQEIALGFLSRDEIERYLAMEFPEHRFPSELPDLIHAKTEGSPLFLVDLVRYLRDRGVIAQENGHWTLARSLPDVQQELPQSVQSMIQRKIDQLGDDDRRLLVAASVQGHQFEAAVVAKALRLDPADVEDRLELLERVHALVRPVDEHEFPDSTLTVRYRFVHALYQNALYGTLKPARRVALSAKVAGALEDFYGEQTTEVASELAFLFETARDFEMASDYFKLAANNAAAVYANEDGVELLGRAIAHAQKLPDQRRHPRILEAVLHRAQLYRTLFRFEDAMADFVLAEATAREAGDTEAEIEAICQFSLAASQIKQIAVARAHAQRALERARAADSSLGVAAAEVALAFPDLCEGELDAAKQGLDRALPVLIGAGRDELALIGTVTRAIYYGAALDYDNGYRDVQWIDERARALGQTFDLLGGLFQRAMLLGNQGRLAEARCTLEQSQRLAEMNHERYWLPRLPNTIGWLYRELQDLETATRLDEEGVQLARQTDSPEAEANSHVNLGHDYLLLDEPARALQHLQAAEKIYEEDIWFRWRYNIRLQGELANYWIRRGDLRLAVSYATACQKAAQKGHAPKHQIWAHKLFGDIAVLEGRMEDARQAYQTALRSLADHPCPMIEWKILKAAANLAREMKQSDLTDQYLGRARAVVQSLAESVRDEKLSRKFLNAKVIRDL